MSFRGYQVEGDMNLERIQVNFPRKAEFYSLHCP